MPQRPSHREINKKIAEGRTALSGAEGLFADPSKAVSELMDLDIGDTKEVWPLIFELLEEICPDHYVGSRPPQKSYEASILGSDLFAFAWDSAKLSRRMYLKFVLREGRFYYVSLHRDRPLSGKKDGDRP